MQKVKTKYGLRWSPKPMKEYLAAWNLGPGVASLHARFMAHPDAWNLFWISAANCEYPPYLSEKQVQFLSKSAQETAGGLVGGRRVGDLALSLMPADFAGHLEAFPAETQELALARTLAPHWLWVIKERSDLFYEARKSDQGLIVNVPVSQGETILDASSNIVAFFKSRGRRT
jgi:hypothetical protein